MGGGGMGGRVNLFCLEALRLLIRMIFKGIRTNPFGVLLVVFLSTKLLKIVKTSLS